MPRADEKQESGSGNARRFATTRWSIVLAAGNRSSPQSASALATLCETYWYSLYEYVRRSGHDADDARDLTQAFFARLLEKNDLAAIKRERGRFRSFLLASLKHFLANEWDRQRAQKRGGGRPPFSIDFGAAEDRCVPRTSMTACGTMEPEMQIIDTSPPVSLCPISRGCPTISAAQALLREARYCPPAMIRSSIGTSIIQRL